MDRIVMGLDGSERDRDVADWVADLAAELRAHVIAAHLVPRATLWMIAGAQGDSGKYLDELREHFEADILASVRSRIPDVHLHVDAGDPAHELAAIAHRSHADLIAIGASPRTVLHDAVFGSLERRLVHLSDVAVVTVPRRSPSLHLLH